MKTIIAKEIATCVVVGLILVVPAYGQSESHAVGLESSIGQLTKLAKSVVLARVDVLPAAVGESHRLRLTECSTIAGEQAPATSELNTGDWLETDSIRRDKPTIVFLASSPFARVDLDAFRFDYQAPVSDGPPQYLVGGMRGMIQMDASSVPDISKVITNYWTYLRQVPRDVMGYAVFLSSLATSSVERVRDDAGHDMKFLIRYGDPSFLKQLAATVPLSRQSKGYLDEILKWKEDGSPLAVRDVRPAEADWLRWLSALDSTSHVTRLSALAEMLRPERREVVAQSSERWHGKVLSLIESPDEQVRTYAAILLSYVSDKRALNVLIDGLQAEALYRRQAAWDALERVGGRSCPRFSPDAPREQREESVKQLRKWFDGRAN